MSRPSIVDIRGAREPLTCLTCYDYLTARVMDEVDGLDMILVGDSLGGVMLGYDSTIPVTIEDMVHHTAAVSRAVKNTFLVTDFPFLEAALELESGVRAARRLMQEGGAQAIKLEGGERNLDLIEHLVAHDVPVIGHLGLTPQSIEALGGYGVQAKTRENIEELGREAFALERAGISALVLECVPEEVGAELTELIDLPTIGIGAGLECSGQVLVWQDMMGLTDQIPTFVRKWGEMREWLSDGVNSFCEAVKKEEFPASEESFSVGEKLSSEQVRELLLEAR